jgi:hypothetical protein
MPPDDPDPDDWLLYLPIIAALVATFVVWAVIGYRVSRWWL